MVALVLPPSECALDVANASTYSSSLFLSLLPTMFCSAKDRANEIENRPILIHTRRRTAVRAFAIAEQPLNSARG